MPNLKNIFNSYNLKIIRSNAAPKICNCRKNITRPFNGHFLLKCVYKASTYNGNEIKEYIDSTGASFKAKYTQQKHNIKSGIGSQTDISKYITTFNNNNDVKIIWSIIHKIFKDVPEKPEMCSICNLERMAIAEANREKLRTLNLRNELSTICPHIKSSYFKNINLCLSWFLSLIYFVYYFLSCSFS